MKRIFIVTAMLIPLAGCQTSSVAQDQAGLNDLLERAKVEGRLNSVEGNNVSVTGRVNLRHRRQQFLWLRTQDKDVPADEQCLQLILPEELNGQIPESTESVTISGTLTVLGSSPGDIYPSYKINGVDVSPYCTAFPGVYLKVQQIASR